MPEKIFNAHSYAVRIEHKLRSLGYAKHQDADSIEADPIGFMDNVLSMYEKQSDRNDCRAADFWEKYEQYKGQSFRKLGEELTRLITDDIIMLF